jgi:hypothetical protein
MLSLLTIRAMTWILTDVFKMTGLQRLVQSDALYALYPEHKIWEFLVFILYLFFFSFFCFSTGFSLVLGLSVPSLPTYSS